MALKTNTEDLSPEVDSVSSDNAPDGGAVSEGIDETPPPKRRRGRPRKVEAEPTEVASANAPAEEKPKRRGRPRKKVEETEQQAAAEAAPAEDASVEAPAEEKPKRRGRPRKKAEESVELGSETQVPAESASVEDAALAQNPVEEKPKRRGRPRKKVEETEQPAAAEAAPTEDVSVEAPAEEKPKRRGRPRKTEQVEKPVDSDATTPEASIEETPAEEKPKRRGRPRKKVEEAEQTEISTGETLETTTLASVDDMPSSEAEMSLEDESGETEQPQTPVEPASEGAGQTEETAAETSIVGVRRRRMGAVRRTISEVDAAGDTDTASEDSPRPTRVRRTRRVTTEEELRAAKAEVDAAKKSAAFGEDAEDDDILSDVSTSSKVQVDIEVESDVDEVEEIEETKPEKVKRKKTHEPTLSLEDLSAWKVTELREKAKELDIDPTGIRKAELIELVFEENAKREGYKSFSGIFDPSQDGFGFIRSNNYISGKEDVFVAKHLIRKFGLRAGDFVEGTTQPPRAHNQLPQLLGVEKINGLDPDEARKRPRFKNLTPIYPDEQLVMEHGKNSITGRSIDIVAPIGKGQRGLIVSPPKAGKTTILKKICESIAVNNPEVHLICLLIDERPEEVTDMRRSIKGEVVASTFDMPPENHTQISELVMERAKRLVEQGEDVVVVLDSITRLARAYNLALPASGRILSGGFDSAALYPPKRFLGAARNIEGGGSLTILASALIDTGSKMDEVIFEEFKGTGNMELKLDRDLSNKRIYPAIDPIGSGTRNEDLLVDELTRKCMWGLRRTLANINNIERAQTMLIKGLKSTRDNQEFLFKAAKKANMSEYADLDKSE